MFRRRDLNLPIYLLTGINEVTRPRSFKTAILKGRGCKDLYLRVGMGLEFLKEAVIGSDCLMADEGDI
jgi:hypothetical protein